jgi:hypothetical protein
MSSKSTILLNNDNEHWYTDGLEPLTNCEPYKDKIVLEFSMENIKVEIDDEYLQVSIINPNCQLYEIISSLKSNLKKVEK